MKAQWLDLLSGSFPCNLTSIHTASYKNRYRMQTL